MPHNGCHAPGHSRETIDWKLWLIDHTRAFRLDTRLLDATILVRCERGLLEKLRALSQETLEAVLKG